MLWGRDCDAGADWAGFCTGITCTLSFICCITKVESISSETSLMVASIEVFANPFISATCVLNGRKVMTQIL